MRLGRRWALVNALENERSCSISRRAERAELLLIVEEAEAGDEGLGGGRHDGKQGWLDPGERAAGRTDLDGLVAEVTGSGRRRRLGREVRLA